MLRSCKNPTSLQLVEFEGKYRDCRKRDNWWLEGIAEYWKHITTPLRTSDLLTQAADGSWYRDTETIDPSKTRFTVYRYESLNLKNSKHLEILEIAAQTRIRPTKRHQQRTARKN